MTKYEGKTAANLSLSSNMRILDVDALHVLQCSSEAHWAGTCGNIAGDVTCRSVVHRDMHPGPILKPESEGMSVSGRKDHSYLSILRIILCSES